LKAVPALTPAPRVALVLGSGGPRGYAHIGVMRVLEDAGIRVDLVVGSSVGSLLGAFWAHGYSAQALDRLSQTGGPLTVFDFSLWADRLAREARRRARIDPELQHADFVIHPDMGFDTRPTAAFFQMARQSGESEAQRLLPQLKVALKKQQAH
jgi:hypothetical protein